MIGDVAQRYLAAVSELGLPRGGGVTASVLAAACVEVLPVDGAGICLTHPDLRVPLCWSDEAVAVAERIQTTLGDGPCLTSAADGAALLADQDVVAARWPIYHQEFREHTPFASVAAVPLARPDEQPFAALNLYAARPDLSTVLPLPDAIAVAAPIAVLLLGLLDVDDDGSARWMKAGPVEDRMLVWRAVGVMMAAHRLDHGRSGDHRAGAGRAGLDDANALATLRAYAYSHDLTLDLVAQRILNRQLQPAQIV